MTSGVTGTLYSVWGNAADDVFVAGESPIPFSESPILHYDGNTWSDMGRSYNSAPLHGVWSRAQDEAFVVGGNRVHRYDGNSWGYYRICGSGALHGVWGSAYDDLLVVGDAGEICRDDGSRDLWYRVTSGTGFDLNDVTGNAAGDVIAVGDHGVILHYNLPSHLFLPLVMKSHP
jgi:photosystem II stability/assembly factor-like uncharacterized protein